MKDLEKRLIYLFTGELGAVIVFTMVCILLEPNYSLIYVVFILNFILLQGSAYWFIKWRRWKTKKRIAPSLSKFLNSFKKINLALLFVAPVIFIIHISQKPTDFITQLFLILFVYGFAIIEYINYYHIQLTNYKNRRGKKSSIAKELYKAK